MQVGGSGGASPPLLLTTRQRDLGTSGMQGVASTRDGATALRASHHLSPFVRRRTIWPPARARIAADHSRRLRSSAVGCPRCGGSDRQAIAPGYWRCRSLVIETVGGPGLTKPGSGPPVIERSEICGFEYQEGSPASASKCFCGMFAIGECHDCKKPLCGNHGGRARGLFLCGEHFETPAGKQRRLELQEAERAAAKEWSDRFEAWTDEARLRLAEHPPVERTVVLIASFFNGHTGPGGATGGWQLQPAINLLSDQSVPTKLVSNQMPWDRNEVLSWFVETAPRPAPTRTRLGGCGCRA